MHFSSTQLIEFQWNVVISFSIVLEQQHSTFSYEYCIHFEDETEHI